MRTTKIVPAIAFAVAACASTRGGALADVQMSGSLVASRACAALQSIRKQTNPGGVALEVGKSYDVVAANKTPADHYLLIVPGANPERRWVATECGALSAAQGSQGGVSTGKSNDAGDQASAGERSKGSGIDAIFAISWQPAFCATKPGKTECRTQTAGRFDATHFTLHGLWPQPRSNAYCGVAQADIENDKSGKWDRLPEVILDDQTRQDLQRVMPGTQSDLERHEWIKHGTCYGEPMQTYFSQAIGLVAEVNGSPVQTLLASRIGQTVTADEIAAAFDAGFGQGAGSRIRVSCSTDPSSGTRMIGEITIALAGHPDSGDSLKTLMLAANPTADRGCPRGVVDAADH